MYKIFTANSKVEKRLQKYLILRKDTKNKLEKLKNNPRKELDAHKLYGRLREKWSCWLGSNLRIIYSINDYNQKVIIEAIGTHKIY